jgi:hypothetical protein
VAGLLGVGLDEIMRRAERARKRRNLFRIGFASAGAVLTLGAVLGWTGAVLLGGRLRSSEVVNIETDAADICEHTSRLDVADVWRAALALECLETLTQGLTGLPKDAHLPQMVVSAVGTNVAILRKFKSEGKLTSEQSDLLDKAEILAARLAQR